MKGVMILLSLLFILSGFLFSDPKRDKNLALGNPSNAEKDGGAVTNYLLERPQYSMSYNAQLGIANWVSWHLNSTWKGDYKRTDPFKPDPLLPGAWYHAKKSDYTNSGFDRGHLCPSDDRDFSKADNDATFFMTNIVPQSPVCNRQTWGDMEDYCRKLVKDGNELYIVAGTYGRGGDGAKGKAAGIGQNKITVPKFLWKAALVLPEGQDDLARINVLTRIVAVILPNSESVNSKPWYDYRVSVDDIENLTGYDLFSKVSNDIEKKIEARVDETPIR